MPARSEQKAEAQEVLAAVDEDRKFVYQATIVRLMKGRKVSYTVRRDSGSRMRADKPDPQAPGSDPGGHITDLGERTLRVRDNEHRLTRSHQTKFTPKVPEIKKAIDYLLDKEYIERAPEANDT